MGTLTTQARNLVVSTQIGGTDSWKQIGIHRDEVGAKLTDGAFGLLVVKDVYANNIYIRRFIPSHNEGAHAEDLMYDCLLTYFGDHGITIEAKIIFYCTKSPCQQCTAKMMVYNEGFGEIYDRLTQSGKQCYFSFVFNEFYVYDPSRGGTRPETMWESELDARVAYATIEIWSEGRITIRHYDDLIRHVGPKPVRPFTRRQLQNFYSYSQWVTND